MTTNEIEKQLKHKAEEQISEHARNIIDGLAMFGRDHTGVNRSGLHWYSTVSYTHLTLPTIYSV